MKRILMLLVVMASGLVAVPVSADPIGTGVVFGLGLLGRQVTLQAEPHWSFRDGCKVASVHVPAAGGGYSYASYDHCKSLPSVYNGKKHV